MESIKELVHVLIIIIVMAIFLEMLLPNSQMQGYVKMVMGLVVIVVVLETGANLIQQDFKFDLPALTSRTQEPPLESLINDGQRLAGLQKQQAMQEYQQGIEKQVLALARLQSDVNIADVKVITTDDPQDANYGRLTGVVLEIASEPVDEQQIAKIESVEIAVDGVPNNQTTALINNEEARQVARNVADFYNIPLEQVRVVERK